MRRGMSVDMSSSHLYGSVLPLIEKDRVLYELFALNDTLYVGKGREQKLGIELLKRNSFEEADHTVQLFTESFKKYIVTSISF